MADAKKPLDAVVCPLCGADLDHDNSGCPQCGYENGGHPEMRLLSFRALMAAPSYPARGALRMDDVSSTFLTKLAEAAVCEHLGMELNG